ncbi:MAG: HAD-IA family hydrolase [Lachnospiraceae bacterium]|nr:HAD-IA family hydrolase [Lachnospiraceae bacterium]
MYTLTIFGCFICLYETPHVQCAAALDFLPHMDGGILSYEDKVIKPMPEIYQLLIDRYGLTPEECVFLDDTQRNLDGAEKFGIHTILFKNQAQAIEELERLGVEA